MSDLPLDLPAPAANARTANRLTLSQSYALGDWIMQHQQQAKDEPDTQCAEHAAIDLGFTVTAANFTAARQARGIEKTKPIAPPTLEERVLELEQQNELLSRKCDSIDRNLATQFTDKLGELKTHYENKLAALDINLANLRAGYNAHQIKLDAFEKFITSPRQQPPPLAPTIATPSVESDSSPTQQLNTEH